MTIAPSAVLQSAYERLSTDRFTPPNYVTALLVAAIPDLSEATPLLSRAEWNDDDGSLSWRIVAADGQRLVRIGVTGPPARYGEVHRPPLQAAKQRVAITPLEGAVKSATVEVVDTTSGFRDADVEWSSTWTIHFADGESLTVPSEEESGRQRTHDQVEQFVHDFLKMALPR